MPRVASLSVDSDATISETSRDVTPSALPGGRDVMAHADYMRTGRAEHALAQAMRRRRRKQHRDVASTPMHTDYPRRHVNMQGDTRAAPPLGLFRKTASQSYTIRPSSMSATGLSLPISQESHRRTSVRQTSASTELSLQDAQKKYAGLYEIAAQSWYAMPETSLIFACMFDLRPPLCARFYARHLRQWGVRATSILEGNVLLVGDRANFDHLMHRCKIKVATPTLAPNELCTLLLFFPVVLRAMQSGTQTIR